MSGDSDPDQMLDRALARAGPAAISSPTAASGWGRWPLASLLGGQSACPCQRTIRRPGSRPRRRRPASRARQSAGRRPGHFPARAKSVIYLFMAGGPSQLELFDYKPSSRNIQRPADPGLVHRGAAVRVHGPLHARSIPSCWGRSAGSRRYGQSGAWVSALLPHMAEVVDDLAIVKSVATDVFNHAPAKLFANTGTAQFGRPSMGSWVTYGIGSESADLPGFVVLQSGPRGPRGGAVNWGNGFLPSAYQGVPLRSGGEPILNLSTPAGNLAATPAPGHRSDRRSRTRPAST